MTSQDSPLATDAAWSYSADLPPEPPSVRAARSFVAACLAEQDLAHLADDVRLVASELVTNALKHAGTPCMVTLEGFVSSVRLAVWDGSTLAPVPVTGSGVDEGGRGLVLVEELSREWGVATGPGGGKAVWAEFPS
ncbi:MAG: ATP-binding protein [Nocardioides sp.]